jgi:beta propeller repeat protein
MKRLFATINALSRPAASLACAVGVAVTLTLAARAQQQYQGFCAFAKIEILQELTLERIGFLATLEVTNNDAVDPITGFTAGLRFTQPQSGGVQDDATSLFWVRQPELININGIDGDGNIAPGAKATVKWFIVPKPGAGGSSPSGVRYYVHCDLAGSMRGEVIPENVMFAIPDMITVKPEPELEITYFQPRDVQGDDPFTEQVEAPVPFTLGVLVKNVGYGNARNVVIRSEQPRIVENKQLLLLIAQLIGCRVMDAPLDRSSLTVNIGDIEPGQARVAAWDMITSLSGTFTEFKATYTHAPEFGGEETSLIRSMNAHFIVHEVLNDTVGRDNVRDFLADTDRDPDQLPDALYESEGTVLPVNLAQECAITPVNASTFTLTGTTLTEGPVYLRVADPGQNKRRIAQVLRPDGTVVNSNNVWTSTRYLKTGNQRLDELHLFDIVPQGDLSYTLTYAADANDTTPPVTSIEFSGKHLLHQGTNYIAPATQVYFLSQDESAVSIEYKPTPEAAWLPALPFSLPVGTHAIAYRATDAAMNVEETKTAQIVVLDPAGDGTALTLAANRTGLSLLSGLASARPDDIRFEFSAPPGPVPLYASVEVFRGIRAWPQLGGLPATPMRPGELSITVSGEAVDHYRWRLNGGAWSAEAPVSEPIALNCTTAGGYTLDVVARSAHGGYPPDADAVRASWAVADDAPGVVLLEAPTHPHTAKTAPFRVSGTDITNYRWSLNANYIRPSAPVSQPFAVSNLTDGAYEVRIFPNLPNGEHTEEGYAAYHWTNRLAYGYDCTGLSCVRTAPAMPLDAGTNFVWDGRNDAGVLVFPGWYTVRVSASNALGQVIWAKAYVAVEELGGSDSEVAAASRGVQRMHGRGDWVVWTDRSGEQWQIWARNIATNGAAFALTSSANTQDDPFTDGRYVVWQGRQEDSTWAVYWTDLTDPGMPIHVLSALPDIDETNPSIYWPWAVWQARDVRIASAPTQLYAKNLVTGALRAVSPTTQDQLDPHVNADRVVWQDWRDVGPGEIYFQDLETGEERRITTSTAGQYKPAMDGPIIVWQDNRNGQQDLYAFDLRDGRETRLTDTPYDETLPAVYGDWVLFTDNALGAGLENLSLLHLASLRHAPMTRTETQKRYPALLTRHIAWLDVTPAGTRVVAGALPSLRGVYAERNAVPVTAQMLETAATAFQLLDRWRMDANVIEVATYEQLWPTVETRRAWRDGTTGTLQGEDFPLTLGMFVWLGFDRAQLIDFGPSESTPLDLPQGTSVLTYSGFPIDYSAFRMMRQLGLQNVRALRLHDPSSGRWQTVQVEAGRLVGTDFPIPRIAVILIDMTHAVNGWMPQ